jgi:hypothetical protein
MSRSTFRFAAVLVVVFALLASSCFAIRGMSMTKDKLGPGERTAIRFELKPYSAGGTQTDAKVFILVGWNNANRVAKVLFDTLENWGGVYEGQRTLGLRNKLLQPGACVAYGFDASDLASSFDNWEAWHTQVNIDATNLTPAELSLSLRTVLKMERPAGTASGEIAELVVFSGGWNDANGSNTYNGGEEVSCTAAVFFDIPFVG